MRPSHSVSPDWWRFGVRPRNAPTLRDLRNLAGSSLAVMTAKAVRTPTPGMLIRWRHMALSLACFITRRSSCATCSLTVFSVASKLRTDASSRSLPCNAAITCCSKDWPQPRCRTVPKTLSRPRIWFFRSVCMPTSCARAPSTARIWWLSRLLTLTSRYQPVRMICARPWASFRSVLLICMLSAALACRASMQITGSPIAFKACQCQVDSGPVSTLVCPFQRLRRRNLWPASPDPHRMWRSRANRGGDVVRRRRTGAAPDNAAFLIDHTDMRQLLRDIQADELFHDEKLHHMGLLRILTNTLCTLGARPQLPHVTEAA